MRNASIEILKTLRDAGHEAYWAGGSVRDMLLGIEPKDFDIATSAKPDDIKELFEKVFPIGESFGVMLAEQNGHHFEIATFRSDSGYSDGRRPDAVLFTRAEEDAQRRDFTMNGLFYDPLEDKILDFIGGEKDINAELVSFIGDPHQRIEEDHLRILRAIRMKNVFGFQYHPDTYKALCDHANLAGNVSGERIRDELNKMIVHESFPQAVMDMEDIGVLREILPEIQDMKGVAQPAEYHTEGDVFDHTILALKQLEPEAGIPLRWAVFLHDSGKPDTFKLKERIRFDHHAGRGAEIAEQIMRRLAFSRRDVEHVKWMIDHHMSVYEVLDMNVGRRRHWFLHEWFLELLELNRCDTAGTIPADLSSYEKVLALYRGDMNEMPERPEKLISGDDVMEVLGMKPGKEVQEVLNELHELQLSKNIETRQEAMEWLGKLAT